MASQPEVMDDKTFEARLAEFKKFAADKDGMNLSPSELEQSIAYLRKARAQGELKYEPASLAAAPPAAAHHHTPTLLQDPAIERWRDMRDHIHEGFRFTRYNTRPALWYGAIIPVAFFAMAYATKDRWSWAGKGRGESLLKHPPPPPAPSAE